jgi:hypothetical protein
MLVAKALVCLPQAGVRELAPEEACPEELTHGLEAARVVLLSPSLPRPPPSIVSLPAPRPHLQLWQALFGSLVGRPRQLPDVLDATRWRLQMVGAATMVEACCLALCYPHSSVVNICARLPALLDERPASCAPLLVTSLFRAGSITGAARGRDRRQGRARRRLFLGALRRHNAAEPFAPCAHAP